MRSITLSAGEWQVTEQLRQHSPRTLMQPVHAPEPEAAPPLGEEAARHGYHCGICASTEVRTLAT